VLLFVEQTENIAAKMVPLYAVRIEDLGPGDFVKIDCAGCGHTALLAPAFLHRVGLGPRRKVLDLKGHVRCRACGARGRAVVSIKWGKDAVIDIWRVAVLMVKRYADDAEANADQRADELETEGDQAGAAIWRRVTVAIEQLTDRTGTLH
jgi:hypothetical protein